MRDESAPSVRCRCALRENEQTALAAGDHLLLLLLLLLALSAVIGQGQVDKWALEEGF
jgi:hypothetical protein